MPKSLLEGLLASLIALGGLVTPASAGTAPSERSNAEVGFLRVSEHITLRRMMIRNPKARGVVLFLHGFPETLYAWQDVAEPLAAEFEVHAFDWPGFGLSSRPTPDTFGYTPRDYAQVLKDYLRTAQIDGSKLTIYATDIGALPALLVALDDPRAARTIIVGDFAPFDRPHHMYQSLQSLKSPASAEQTRIHMNRTRDEILENAFRRGLPPEAQFETSSHFKQDMLQGWSHGGMTSADAFYHYYSGFTRDQNLLEANLHRLKTPVKVIWGEEDLYIDKDMGIEFARRIDAELTLLPGIGHYPHLQDAAQAVQEVRSVAR